VSQDVFSRRSSLQTSDDGHILPPLISILVFVVVCVYWVCAASPAVYTAARPIAPIVKWLVVHNGPGVSNGTARRRAQPLDSSVMSEAASSVWQARTSSRSRDEICTSNQAFGLSVLWSPISCIKPRKRQRMRRRAPTRGDSTERPLASRRTACPCRCSTCVGSAHCRSDVGSAHPPSVIQDRQVPSLATHAPRREFERIGRRAARDWSLAAR
jgi:hypothetical protein